MAHSFGRSENTRCVALDTLQVRRLVSVTGMLQAKLCLKLAVDFRLHYVCLRFHCAGFAVLECCRAAGHHTWQDLAASLLASR